METKEQEVNELKNSIADYRVVNIEEIIPYWRNAWDNNAMAVNAVADSIEEFTFYNPIIVDKDMTIICGHTRYKALKQLGAEQALVMVSDLDELTAKQYRIADNKTTEISNWLLDKVREEYAQLPHSKTLDEVFPTIMMSDPSEAPKPLESPFTQATEEKPDWDDVVIELICPNCLNGIEAKWGQIKELIKKGESRNGD